MRPTGNWSPALDDLLTAFLPDLPLPRPDMVTRFAWSERGGGGEMGVVRRGARARQSKGRRGWGDARGARDRGPPDGSTHPGVAHPCPLVRRPTALCFPRPSPPRARPARPAQPISLPPSPHTPHASHDGPHHRQEVRLGEEAGGEEGRQGRQDRQEVQEGRRELQALHLQGPQAGAPRHRHLLQGDGHPQLVHRRHVREDRGPGLAGASGLVVEGLGRRCQSGGEKGAPKISNRRRPPGGARRPRGRARSPLSSLPLLSLPLCSCRASTRSRR